MFFLHTKDPQTCIHTCKNLMKEKLKFEIIEENHCILLNFVEVIIKAGIILLAPTSSDVKNQRSISATSVVS